MTRRIGAAVAGIVLLLSIVGPPVVLLMFGRAGALAGLGWRDVVARPDDGRLLLGVLTLIGWFAWAVWTASVALEFAGRLRGRDIRLPVFGMVQAAASALIVAALASGPPAIAQEPTAGPVAPAAQVSTPARPMVNESPAPQDDSTGRADDEPTYTVAPGDDLWSIAERLLGDGLRWRDVAAANPHVADPEHIEAGWQLRIPGWSSTPSADLPPAAVATGDRHGAAANERTEDLGRDPELGVSRDDVDTDERVAAGTAPAALPEERVSEEARPATGGASPDAALASAVARGPSAEAANSASASPAVEGSAAGSSDVEAEADAVDRGAIPGSLLGLAGFSAAAIVGGVALRRRQQQSQRDVGRRVAPASVPAQRLEVVLGRLEDTCVADVLTAAQQAIAAHCRERSLPRLMLATVGERDLTLELDTPADPPPGFRADGSSWVLRRQDAALLLHREGPLAYPGLLAVGESADGTVLVDLEEAGVLGVIAADAPSAVAALVAAAAATPWAADVELVATQAFADVVTAGSADVQLVADAADALSLPPPSAAPREERLDPERASELAPRLVFVDTPVTRLEATPGVGVVMPAAAASWVLDVDSGELRTPTHRVTLRPPALEGPWRGAFADLAAAATATATEPAPWWRPDTDGVAVLNPAASLTPAPRPWENTVHDPPRHSPELLLLGPIDLVGCAGDPPPRAVRQCMEYVAWLLENPGATASQMASSLIVAEGTRRSNLSRLRSWLGATDDGEPYLPDAYSGRLELHPLVTSDWVQLQMLVAPGVNRCRLDTLTTALSLVRGAPLADAAPSQWHWAEPMRSDMVSLIRDIGVQAAELAWVARDVDYVRWATARALAAAPEDELLLCARIRAEAAAGNRAEVERLVWRVTRHARSLQVDLRDDTVMLLQEVMEGHVRARAVG